MPFRHSLFFLCAATLSAQHSETTLSNPFSTAADRRIGAALYRSQCANCHGIDGKGGASGPNLSTGNFRHASNDEGLFRVISKGVAGTSMPGFSMNGREVWQIVASIRSLSSIRTAGVATGNANAGQQLFQANRCLNCHFLNGTGSPRGLDLSRIASRLSIEELRLALVDPSAAVAPEYWIWQATTNDGQSLRGSRLNEDTFSIQILDSAGKLRTILKSAIASQSLEARSPMPSFKDKLSQAQLNDLVAFLATLTAAEAQ